VGDPRKILCTIVRVDASDGWGADHGNFFGRQHGSKLLLSPELKDVAPPSVEPPSSATCARRLPVHRLPQQSGVRELIDDDLADTGWTTRDRPMPVIIDQLVRTCIRFNRIGSAPSISITPTQVDGRRANRDLTSVSPRCQPPCDQWVKTETTRNLSGRQWRQRGL
jgi:hypothetical protein